MYNVNLTKSATTELVSRITSDKLSKEDKRHLINLVDTYRYPHPAVTVDIIIFTVQDEQLKLLLIKRGIEPYLNKWALPGGFLQIADNESLEIAAARELEEETGVKNIFLKQLATFGEPNRDPRERVISVAYYAIMPSEELDIKAGSDASDACWFNYLELPELAFDHDKIIKQAHETIISNIKNPQLSLQFVPDEFTLFELQKTQEIILCKNIDKRNFRSELKKQGYIDVEGSENGCMSPTGKKKASPRGPAAELYKKHSLDNGVELEPSDIKNGTPVKQNNEALERAYKEGFNNGVKNAQKEIKQSLSRLIKTS